MELTANNVDTVLGVYPERLFDVFPQVFELLVDPNIEEMALYHYVVSIQEQLQKDADSRPGGHMGFSTFGEAAFEGGIVKAMMKITQDPRTDKWRGLAAYFALDAMWHLMRTATSEERRALMKELLEHDGLRICMDKLQNHPLVIHRQVAACVLRCFTSESFLGEMISSIQTSDLIRVLCKHILVGPALYEQQMRDPALTWQSFPCFGKFGTSREKAARYAPRYYAMSQENAALAIQGLFIRCPPPTQSFCHEVLRQDPEILDLLFKCTATPRPPYYPELAVDSMLSEAIVMMFRIPQLTIPGISIELDRPAQQEAEREREAVLAAAKLLTTRPGWVDMIFKVWDMITDEKWQDLKRMFDQVVTLYEAQGQPDHETFLATFEFRGSCRICLERLVATLSHFAGPDSSISDADLLMLLRLTHNASRTVKTNINQLRTQQEQHDYIEGTFELYRKPLSAFFTEEEVEPPIQVADESVMGPTAHARILTLLAQRGILQKMSQMKSLPNGVSGTRMNLTQLKEIASQDAIRHFLVLARQRVSARREVGNRRFKKDEDKDFAFLAFHTAAELASALIMFDEATQRLYGGCLAGVRRELVLCLGNGAEMASGLGWFERALYMSMAAVEKAECLEARGNGLDVVDNSVRDKNRRRVERARVGLGEKS